MRKAEGGSGRDRTVPDAWGLLVVLGVLFWAAVAHSATDPGSQCDRAAELAARQTGVPLAVLMAITRAETGRGKGGVLVPWPWTVNMEGAGRWFDTEQEARAYVEDSRARGARSFDIGCFQINHLWHGKAFASVEDMFDPARNARYAAEFLKSLYAETGSWPAAAGAYHSRTPDRSARYAERFVRIHDSLPAAGAPVAPWSDPGEGDGEGIVDDPASLNRFPLLLAGQSRGRGSLVPLDGGGEAVPLFLAQSGAMY
jgi:hypothetical protein